MEVLLHDGFEFSATWNVNHYGHNWAGFTGSINTSTVRTGSRSLNVQNDPGEHTVDLGTPADLNVAMAVNFNDDLTTRWVQLRDAVSGNVHLQFQRLGGVDTGKVRILGPGGTTLGTTSSSVIPFGAWVHLEVKANIHNSTGSAKVRVNGVEVLSVTGVDTQNGSNAFIGSVNLIRDRAIQADDFAVGIPADANDWFGDCKVVETLPGGAGNYTQFTPSAGSNFQNVDDTTIDDDTTRNTSSTNGHKDSYNNAALGVTGTVIAVDTLAYMRKDDAGSRSARVFTRLGGVDHAGSDISLLDTYKTYKQSHGEVNPETAAAWTVSDVDGSEPGVEVRS